MQRGIDFGTNFCFPRVSAYLVLKLADLRFQSPYSLAVHLISRYPTRDFLLNCGVESCSFFRNAAVQCRGRFGQSIMLRFIQSGKSVIEIVPNLKRTTH